MQPTTKQILAQLFFYTAMIANVVLITMCVARVINDIYAVEYSVQAQWATFGALCVLLTYIGGNLAWMLAERGARKQLEDEDSNAQS